MQITLLKEEMFNDFQKFIHLCWQDTYKNILEKSFIDEFVTKAYSIERLKVRMQQPFYVVFENNEIIGMANFSNVKNNGEVFLAAIYIHPQHKGKGIGSILLNKGMGELSPKVITLEVEKENKAAISFYLKKGFIIVDEYEEHLFGHSLRTLKMKKDVE